MPAGNPLAYLNAQNGLERAFGEMGPLQKRARKSRQASQDPRQSSLSSQDGRNGMLGKLLGGSPLRSLLNF